MSHMCRKIFRFELWLISYLKKISNFHEIFPNFTYSQKSNFSKCNWKEIDELLPPYKSFWHHQHHPSAAEVSPCTTTISKRGNPPLPHRSPTIPKQSLYIIKAWSTRSTSRFTHQQGSDPVNNRFTHQLGSDPITQQVHTPTGFWPRYKPGSHTN